MGDPEDRVNRRLREGAFTFPGALGGAAKGDSIFARYRVKVYPTNYLIDAAGNVVYATEGFDEEAMRAALGRLGFGDP